MLCDGGWFRSSHVVPYRVTMDSTARVSSSSSMLLLFMMVHGGGSILLLLLASSREVLFQSSIAWKFHCVKYVDKHVRLDPAATNSE